MKKLTKKFIKKELQHMAFKDERIIDIDILYNGMCAKIITITKEHIPQIYIMRLCGQRVLTYFDILSYDSCETFIKPISITKV